MFVCVCVYSFLNILLFQVKQCKYLSSKTEIRNLAVVQVWICTSRLSLILHCDLGEKRCAFVGSINQVTHVVISFSSNLTVTIRWPCDNTMKWFLVCLHIEPRFLGKGKSLSQILLLLYIFWFWPSRKSCCTIFLVAESKCVAEMIVCMLLKFYCWVSCF